MKLTTLLYLASIPAMTPAIMLRGFVLTKLWRWFVADVYGLPALHLSVAIGVSAMFHLLSPPNMDCGKIDDENVERKFVETMIRGFVGPTFYLMFGWIVTWFM